MLYHIRAIGQYYEIVFSLCWNLSVFIISFLNFVCFFIMFVISIWYFFILLVLSNSLSLMIQLETYSMQLVKLYFLPTHPSTTFCSIAQLIFVYVKYRNYHVTKGSVIPVDLVIWVYLQHNAMFRYHISISHGTYLLQMIDIIFDQFLIWTFNWK